MDFRTVDELNEYFGQKSIELIVAREQMIYEAAVWYASQMVRLEIERAAALAKLQPHLVPSPLPVASRP